ncbi:hypothetical protein FO519_001601 [Halicephalobus sp. NKZ332]|nr:hypothetical protein FO519_001601 [Halicephalobus sp. NKZ332]
MDDRRFHENDLVWAKIKGFPMWPAKIIEAQNNGKYFVSFFGTRETSFLKLTDLLPYMDYRMTYEKHKNQKPEYRLALDEIRMEAGLSPLEEEEDKKPLPEDLLPESEGSFSSSSFGRVRKPSMRIADYNFITPGSRRRHNSNSISFDFNFERQRTDSTSSLLESKRAKIPSITEYADIDLNLVGSHISIFTQQYFQANNFLQGDLGLSGVDSDYGNGTRISRRRRTTSKLLSEIVNDTHSRARIPSASSDPNGMYELLDNIANNMDISEFYRVVDALPSEESDRPQTPENISPMPRQSHVCSRCNIPQKYVEYEWKCPNNCGEYTTQHDVRLDNMEDLESYFDTETSKGLSVFSFKHENSQKKSVKIDESSIKPSDQNKPKRPRSYKVEKTPPVQSNGVRLCIFCNGHVRPQMCGGNKHRWRCVDKRCRKWYGWVRSNEEIPKDLGRKGRWKDLQLKVKGHTEDGRLVQMVPDRSDSPIDESKIKKKKKKADPPKPLSPLTEEKVNYVPTQLESKVRWWRPDRRRVEPSPEKELSEPSFVDFSASLKITEHSAIAMDKVTRALEDPIDPGSAAGFVDHMFDYVFSSMGTLMATAAEGIPYITDSQPELPKKLFESTLDHLPLQNQ